MRETHWRSVLAMIVLAASSPAMAAEESSPIPPSLEQLYRQEVGDTLKLINPMTPDDIAKQRTRMDQQERAAEPAPAHMRTETRFLSLQPGSVPQAIRLSAGYASTVIFTDATGAPWPVTAFIIGNPQMFNVVRPEGLKPGNLLSIVPLSNHGTSNLTITLENQTYPVVVHLLTESAADSRRTSDSLVSFRIDQRGPQAEEPLIGPSRAPTVTPALLSFLDGVPPEGSTVLSTSTEDAAANAGISAWAFQGKYYVRSRGAMVWPAWTAVANGGDGIRVYEIPPAPSLLLSLQGKNLEVAVEEGTGGPFQ